MSTTGGNEPSFSAVVQAALGVAPQHIVGLPNRGEWIVENATAVTCPDCVTPAVLVLQRLRSIADGAVVCPTCGWAEAVNALPRDAQRAIRSGAVASRPPDLVSHRAPEGNTPVDTMQLETELRDELRGRRLVCEIGLDEQRQRTLNDAFKQLRDRGITTDAQRLARQSPAITAAFLVAAATHGYTAGNLYDNLPIIGLDGPTLGRAFERILDDLRLERFDAIVDEGALRYVARILGHVGIPEYCCDDFFYLVLDELRRGVDDGTEIISRLRLAPSRLTNVDKPVGRFLLHGGPIARDFLDRAIEMLSDWTGGSLGDAASYGLPLYVYDALTRFDHAGTVTGGARDSRSKAPRPWIFIDPWDPSGPLVSLPPVPAKVGSGSWRVSSGDSTWEVRSSNLETRTVSLSKSLSWNVDLTLGGAVVRRSQFVGLGTLNAIAFDPAGLLLRDPTRVSANSLRLLRPQDAELVGDRIDGTGSSVRVIEEFPAPTGDWSGFSLVEVDVRGLRRLIVRRAGSERSCWVTESRPPPALSHQPLADVTTMDGLPIYSTIPHILLPDGVDKSLWQFRLTIDGRRHEVAPEPESPGVLALTPVAPSKITTIELGGRGPLGSDFVAHFVVVAGLSIDRPRRVVLPGHSRPALTIRADPAIAIERQRAGTPFAQEVRTLGDRTSVHLADDATSIEVAIGLPLLLWSLATRDRRTELDAEPIRTAVEDILNDASPLLKVRCGLEGVRLSAELECRGEILYATPTITTAPAGRWVFDLTPAKDALRVATTTVTLRLRVDGMPVIAALLRQDPDVAHVEVQLLSDGQLSVRWSEGRTVIDRVVRMWPLSSPWTGYANFPIPDDAASELVINGNELASGAYLVEVAIDDGWSAPFRPRVGSPSTAQIVVRSRAPRSDEPLDVLASAITTGRYTRLLTDQEIDHHASEMLQALESEITLGPDPTTEASFRQTCEFLANRPLALAQALDDGVRRGVEPDTYLALGIELARHIPTPNLAAASPSLWAAAPVIAARLDLANGDAESQERVETHLGIASLEGWQPDGTVLDDKNVRVLMSLEAGQLRLLMGALDAVPVHLLDPETRQLAAFEWAIGHRRRNFDAVEWVGEHSAMVARLPLPSWGEPLVAAEQVGGTTARAFPQARLPELVMRCAVMSIASEEPLPRRALQRLRRSAPLSITRSMVLASTAQAIQGGIA